MRAAVLEEIGKPLVLKEMPIPKPSENQVLIRVHACAVCRTDLHIIDGDLTHPKLPLIPGHMIVGSLPTGQKVCMGWLGETCGTCRYCLEGKENLCDHAIYTGYTRNGGFAEYCVANPNFVFHSPLNYEDEALAPLLCAGLIGYRAYKLTEKAQKIGFYGFGSSAHILIQLIRHLGGEVYVFTRSKKEFARTLGATWVGDIEDKPPTPLDAAILFAPVGEHYIQALQVVKKGGAVISAGIHMSDIPAFAYRLLWGERSMRSVSNLTREDGKEFLEIAPKIPLVAKTKVYPLEKVNEALSDLRDGRLQGTAVIKI